MQFSAMETLMVALLVLGAGQWIVHKVELLSRLNMPEPVVGGLLATIIVTVMQVSGISLTFDESIKTPPCCSSLVPWAWRRTFAYYDGAAGPCCCLRYW